MHKTKMYSNFVQNRSKMKTLSISELRANLLSAIESIKKGETITVTSHGKPVARLIRYRIDEKKQ